MLPSGRIGNSSWSLATHSTQTHPPQPLYPSGNAFSVQGSSNQGAHIPIPQEVSPGEAMAKEPLVARTSVAPSVRSLFSFEFFNRMQSKCFNVLYRGDDNVVIGAPTAAGKTVCFEVAMARLFSSATYKKVLYIAPLKSLVQERLKDWQKKFNTIGLSCQELSGDTGEALQPSRSVYLTTPEKWDAITRHWKDHADILENIALVLIDEVHILSDERGACLEAVITRLKFVAGARPPRMVALSASTPNIKDIGEWLGAPPGAIFYFGEEHRPITPKLHVLGYPASKNDFLFEKSLDFKLWSVIASYSEGKPTLAFTSSRKSTIASASKLLEMCSQNGSSYVKSDQQKERLFEAARKVQNDPQLASCLMAGIAYHNAGMSTENRGLVERLFATGTDVMVMIATSTLAAGVNLPAFLVIIKSTTVWTASHGTEECSPATIRQMIGRAGRPQFGDTSAKAVIMTRQDKVASYEQILECDLVSIESVLHKHLHDALLTEVYIGNITSIPTALNFLQQTFLRIRLAANPSHYLSTPSASAQQSAEERVSRLVAPLILTNSTPSNTASPTNLFFKNRSGLPPAEPSSVPSELQQMAQLRAWCMMSLAALSKAGCIVVENQILELTDFGRSLTRNFVSFQAAQAFFNTFPPSSGPKPHLDLSFANLEALSASNAISTAQLLECVCSSPQFGDVIVRRAEKQELKKIASENRFPITKGIGKAQKISILIQAVVQGTTIADQALRQEATSLITTAVSLLACLAHFFLKRGWFHTLHRSLLLWKGIRKSCWSQHSPQTSQVPIISKDMAKVLASIGCFTLSQLAHVTPKTLEQTLQRNPQFIASIQTRLHTIPKFSLSAHVLSNGTGSLEIRFTAFPMHGKPTSESFDHRWLVVGQHGVIVAAKILPFPLQSDRPVSFSIPLNSVATGDLDVIFASEEWLGFDVVGMISVDHTGVQQLLASDETQDVYRDVPVKTKKRARRSDVEATPSRSRPLPSSKSDHCQHKCRNKFTCKHGCCKLHPDVNATGEIELHLEGRAPFAGEKSTPASELPAPTPKRFVPPHGPLPLPPSTTNTNTVSSSTSASSVPYHPNVKTARMPPTAPPAQHGTPSARPALSTSSPVATVSIVSSNSDTRYGASAARTPARGDGQLQPLNVFTTRPTQGSFLPPSPPPALPLARAAAPPSPTLHPPQTIARGSNMAASGAPKLISRAVDRSQVAAFHQFPPRNIDSSILPVASKVGVPAHQPLFVAEMSHKEFDYRGSTTVLQHPQPTKGRPSFDVHPTYGAAAGGARMAAERPSTPKMGALEKLFVPERKGGDWASLLNWELDPMGPEP